MRYLCAWFLFAAITILPSIPGAQEPGIVADFTVTRQTTVTPANFWFVNQSQGEIDRYLWDFGDGATSSQYIEVHMYAAPGDYTVTLTAYGAFGSDSKSQIVKVRDVPEAFFSVLPINRVPNIPIQLTDTSIGPVTEWFWLLDEHLFSREQNPSLVFDAVGSYKVRLRVNGPGGDDQVTRTVYVVSPELNAAFSATPDVGYIPLQVQFTNQTFGPALTYQWDFGDGQASTLKHPLHTYTAQGQYVVTLVVTGYADPDTAQTTVYVYSDAVNAPILEWSPAAGFVGDGVAPDQSLPLSVFEFRVVFTQTELQPPNAGYPRLLLDGNMDGDADDPGEGAYDMSLVEPAEPYQFSREYTCQVTLVSNGTYQYRFEAICGDGLAAVGEPAQWQTGPIVDPGDQPDLFLREDEIFFSVASLPVYEGDPVMVHVPVYNRGGVAASCRVVVEIWSTSGPTWISSSTSVVVGPSDSDLGLTIAKIPSYKPYTPFFSMELFYYTISLTDVDPPEVNPNNSWAEVELGYNGNIVGAVVSGFTATSLEQGVELAWTSSDVEAQFHVERRDSGTEDWIRATDAPVDARGAQAGAELSFMDMGAARGADLQYRLLGRVSGEEWQEFARAQVSHGGSLPAALTTGQWSPNPFNPSTTLSYALPRPGPVRIAIYDVSGRQVRELVNGSQGVGPQTVEWNGRSDANRLVPAGVYFARLEACGMVQTRKLALVK